MTLSDLAPLASYRVERHPHGVAIVGPIPVLEMVALLHIWQSQGFDTVDSHISAKLGASLVVTTREGSTKWRQQLGIE